MDEVNREEGSPLVLPWGPSQMENPTLLDQEWLVYKKDLEPCVSHWSRGLL